MSRQNHDVYQDHYMLAWAHTDQAKLRRVAAEERLARQVRPARPVGPFLWLAARLRQVGAGLWMAVHSETVRLASMTSHDVPADAAYDCSSGPGTEVPWQGAGTEVPRAI